MRAGYQGFVQAQYLQRVMPAAFDQAAAHKTGIGYAIPEHQLAHAVAQQNLGSGHRVLAQAVPRKAQAGTG